MSNITTKLNYSEFPECSKEALNFVVKTFSSDPNRGVPGRSSSGDSYAINIAQEYVIDKLRKRGKDNKKFYDIHELQLLEMLCSALQSAPEHACYNIFHAIFGGHVDQTKITFMTKLVSMAISVSAGPVLGCAALWMQEKGSQSQSVCDLAQMLVDDYCLLYQDNNDAFKNLPKVSSLFTCNFITALTTIYPYTDISKSPPHALLQCIVDWISSDSCLCSDSVRLVRIQSTFTCPISGLVRWCILGPLVTVGSCQESSKSKNELESDKKTSNQFSESKLQSLFSKLHLGVLSSLQAYKSMELNEHLLTLTDLIIVSKMLASFYKGGNCTEDMIHIVNISTDRLAQVIQVALTTASLPGENLFYQSSKALCLFRLCSLGSKLTEDNLILGSLKKSSGFNVC
ncbi:hypothetical protein ACF0H5_001859 [Mactra antiquata]